MTEATSRLEYQVQAGALMILFGRIRVIIGNRGKPVGKWVWKSGVISLSRSFLRSLSDPARFDQPRHMRNYRKATPPYTYERNDTDGSTTTADPYFAASRS